MSRDRLAELCGVTRAAVSHWENGIHAPDRRSRLLLAAALGVSVEVVDSWFPQREAVA